MAEEKFDELVDDGANVLREGIDLIVPKDKRGVARQAVEAVREAVGLGQDIHALRRDGPTRAGGFDIAERALESVAQQADLLGAPAPVAAAARLAAEGLELIEDALEARDRRKPLEDREPETGFRSARLGTLPPVEIEFRLLRGEPRTFEICGMRLEEGLGELFTMDLDLLVPDAEMEEAWIGASCEVRIFREVEERVVYGVVATIAEHPGDDGGSRVAVQVVPALHLLSLECRSEIFQGYTAQEILTQTLERPLRAYGRTLRFNLRGRYAARDYCVRFRESTLAFALRVIGEEGWVLTFVPDEDTAAEVILVLDHADDDPKFQDGEEIPYVVQMGSESLVEGVASLSWRQTAVSHKVSCTTYNWRGPTWAEEDVQVEEGAPDHPLGIALELPARVAVDDPVQDPRAEAYTGLETPPAKAWAKHALAACRRHRTVAEGGSNLAGLTPGQRLSTGPHPLESLDRRTLLVTRVHHEAEIRRAAAGEEGHGATYRNKFWGVDAGAPLHPPAPLKPQVHGAQLATVVGPAGEEIFTDRFGRIKVRFHWDRYSPDNERSSCWIRVAQSSAGAGFGAVFLPRVGMEVLVHFIDGDPDAPLVVGCVYNGASPPPYPLPEERARSGVVTRSSLGGEGRHELCFDDTAQRECLGVRAQRRLHVDVKGDESRVVDNDQTIVVKHDRDVVVEHHERTVVAGNQTTIVRGKHGPDAQSGLGASSTVEHGDYTVNIHDGQMELRASRGIVLMCGESKIEMTPERIKFDSPTIHMTAAFAEGVSSNIPTELVLEHDRARLQADSIRAASVNAQLEIENDRVQLAGGLMAESSLRVEDGKFTVEASATTFRGVDWAVEASQNAVLTGTMSASLISRGTAEVTGGKTNLVGRPIHLNPAGGTP